MDTRIEIDPLGEKAIPINAYFGIQTYRAVENFPVSGLRASPYIIEAYVMIKRAAATANMQVGWLDKKIGYAIIQACDDVLAGKFRDQFVIDVFQAGAGTSFNMNTNEVLANRALEILGKPRGDYKSLSPTTTCNGAITNDTYPNALHVLSVVAFQPLLKALDELSAAFMALAKVCAHIESGRTHLQDAVPVTMGKNHRLRPRHS
jgi:aspartate ammonia-lyase